jgi:hypothetical protein
MNELGNLCSVSLEFDESRMGVFVERKEGM